MFETIQIKDCKTGMTVRVTKTSVDTSEVWVGAVKAVKKPNKFVLYIDCPVYFKNGTKRDRWARKVVKFANSTALKFEYNTDDWKQQAQRVRDFRKAYVGARTILQQRRTENEEHFRLLGIPTTASYDDFNAIRRSGAKRFHPDIVSKRAEQLVAEGKNDEAKTLLLAADTFMRACGWVADYISKRDANNRTT